MCCRSAFTKPIFSRYEMKTAIPPNGVTARCVSRRIKRSSDNSASISRGTGLSVAFGLILLLSQILAAKPTPNFGFPDKTGSLDCQGECVGQLQRLAGNDKFLAKNGSTT